VQVLARNFPPSKVDSLLGDICSRVTPDQVDANREVRGHLRSIVESVLSSFGDMKVVYNMVNFTPLADLFQNDAKVEIAKAILRGFAAPIRAPGEAAWMVTHQTLNDYGVTQALFETAK
jgi:hypothetical protein